jgi:hypothetical protein
MLKAFINSVILFILLLINMGLFTWCVNQLLYQTPLKKTLISPVQADASPQARKPIVYKGFARPITQKPIQNHSTRIASNPTHQGATLHKIVLHFQAGHIHLKPTERIKLENKLRSFDITISHGVRLLSGAAFSENSISSPQIAKLRSQNVARIIYPYTQTIKMYYRPSMEEGKVIVEFFELKTKNY